jgi:hypothetical protein
MGRLARASLAAIGLLTVALIGMTAHLTAACADTACSPSSERS